MRVLAHMHAQAGSKHVSDLLNGLVIDNLSVENKFQMSVLGLQLVMHKTSQTGTPRPCSKQQGILPYSNLFQR